MYFKIFVYVILLLLLRSNTATACSCSKGARLVKYEVKRSTLVLVGKVVSVEGVAVEMGDSVTIFKDGSKPYFQKITFQVSRLFKGKKKGERVVVYTGLSKGDCGFSFVVGKRYILYGTKSASPFWRNGKTPPKMFENAYWTDICTRTQRFNSVEMAELKKVRRMQNLEKKNSLLKASS